MSKRTARQQAIRAVVREGVVRTQRDVVEHLEERGFSCTQATVSRDIAVMGVEKASDGVYVLPEDLHLRRLFSELVTDVIAAENLVVVKSMPGGAQSVAAALDAAEVEGIIGSIAGDDTIVLVAATSSAAGDIVDDLERFRV